MNSVGEIAIRAALSDDIDAVLALDRSMENLPHWAAADYRAATAEVACEPQRCLFVAESDGEIVGLAGGVMHAMAGECWAELETVGVAPGIQRRGLGRALCRAVIGWCQSCGAAHIDLEVRSGSAGAITLYRELGFVIAGKRPGYYREPADDAVLMRLYLKHGPARPAEMTP